MGAVIHFHHAIPWHVPFANRLVTGLKAKGIGVKATSEFRRIGDLPILLGTTLWHGIEQDGGEYLLVDRCHYGDTNHWVALARNGRGYRARWPDRTDPSRWEKHGQDLLPWRLGGSRVVLCGQVGSYSPDWESETSWYRSVHATHFRPHPQGANPTGLPISHDWEDTRCAVVLNSSIAVQTVLCGIPTVTMDMGSMAWPITGHTLDDIRTEEREAWAHWLAWCQWSHDEIAEGTPWDFLW
jgi:hypothetical protein